MADKKQRAENMRMLHDTLIYTLSEKERKHFTLILSDFQSRRGREKFVLSLRRLLSSPSKQEVIPYLVAILPNREREHFLQLWMKTSDYNVYYKANENRNNKQVKLRVNSRNNLNNSYPIHQRQQITNRNNPYITDSLPRPSKTNSPAARPLSALSSNQLSVSVPSLRSASQQGKQSKTHLITLRRSSKSSGFGFSIRGGAEHGLGIFISSVDEGSVADKKNLSVGDQIIKLNEHNFQNIDHATAVQIILQSKKLKMLVFSSDLVPGARLAHMEYQWVDTNGRAVSPPLNHNRKDDFGRSRSVGDIRLLQDDEERRVIVHIRNGARLGLRIRGGLEYGLGIFVSSVDRNYAAEKSGIRAGDQILDVNGLDFLEIAHKDAVRVLKSYRMMSMIVKYTGKIPYSRTLFKKTEWLDSARTSRSSSVISLAQDGGMSPSPQRSLIRQGIAGSQLMHQSSVVVPAHRMIEEQARPVLNDKELSSLKYYISEYIQGEINVDGLVIALFHLLDSSVKVDADLSFLIDMSAIEALMPINEISLLNDVRTVIFPQDIDLFDRLVLEKEMEAMKSLNRETPRKDRSESGHHLVASDSYSQNKTTSTPSNPSTYRPMKSPRQSFSKMSPPTTPLPSIPDVVYEEPFKKIEMQNHQQSPVIDYLSDLFVILSELHPREFRNSRTDLEVLLWRTVNGQTSSSYHGDLSFEDEDDFDYEDNVYGTVDAEKRRINFDGSSENVVPHEAEELESSPANNGREDFWFSKREESEIQTQVTARDFAQESVKKRQALPEGAERRLNLQEGEARSRYSQTNAESSLYSQAYEPRIADDVNTVLHEVQINRKSPPQNHLNDAAVDHIMHENRQEDSSDVGFSLIRSALLGFAEEDREDDCKDENRNYLLQGESAVSTNEKRFEFTSDRGNSDENDFSAIPKEDDFSSFGIKLGNFRPRYEREGDVEFGHDNSVSEMRLSEVAETKGEEFRRGESCDVRTESHELSSSGYHDSFDGKEIEEIRETSFSGAPAGSIDSESVDENNEEPVFAQKELFGLSSLMHRTNIGKNGNNNDDELPSFNEDTSNDVNTSILSDLQESEAFADDLEFEFDEDEPEIAETTVEEKDEDLLSLKFAPIQMQETAPSSPNLDSKKNKACSRNFYEKDPTILRIAKDPIVPKLPLFTGNNRRQRFDVQDISDDKIGGFQNYSPKLLTKHSFNENTEAKVLSTSKSTVGDTPRSGSSYESETDVIYNLKNTSEGSENQTLREEVLNFPERSITNKRIPIISYKAGSPEKRDGNSDVMDPKLSLKHVETKSVNENNERRNEDSLLPTVHSLRSIFEHQRLDTPRTEYLSEIIKKNNTEGRKRIKSTESYADTRTEGIEKRFSVKRDLSVDDERHGKVGANDYQSSVTTESDLSSTDDFDFSSSISRAKMDHKFSLQSIDDKIENSSGYGSEDYSPVSESRQMTVRIEKGRPELGLLLEATRKERRGVQIKTIEEGDSYAANQCQQLRVGQEVVSVDGESLQGICAQIALITLKRAFNNPSGRYLDIVVKNNAA